MATLLFVTNSLMIPQSPTHLVCSEYIRANCAKYMTLKPLEPRHPERKRQCIQAESVTVGLRWMSLRVSILNNATGLS